MSLRWANNPSRGSSNTHSFFMLKKQEKTTESYEPVGVKRLYFYYTRVGSEDLDTHMQLSSVILA